MPSDFEKFIGYTYAKKLMRQLVDLVYFAECSPIEIKNECIDGLKIFKQKLNDTFGLTYVDEECLDFINILIDILMKEKKIPTKYNVEPSNN